MNTTTTQPPRHDLKAFAKIPGVLIEGDQFVCWRYITRAGDKPTKVPYCTDGRTASTTDPYTWCSYSRALEAAPRFDGIGRVFAADDFCSGIDLDNCIGEGGELLEWAADILEHFAGRAYAEISPSNRGIKLWTRGRLDGDDKQRKGKKKSGIGPDGRGAIEMYDRGRYFTMTGRNYGADYGNVGDGQAELLALYDELFKPPPVKPDRQPSRPATDAEDRCVKYLKECTEAVSGAGGHDATYRAACECIRFDLDDAAARRVLQWFNANKCSPPWTDAELEHKLDSARANVTDPGSRLRDSRPINGHSPRPGEVANVGDDADDTIIDPRDPLAVAKCFVDECYIHIDGRTIHHSADLFYGWDGTAYSLIEPAGLRAQLYPWLAAHRCMVQRGDDEIELPIKPTKTMVDGVIDALRAVAYIARQSPCWMADAVGLPDPAKCIVGPSGIYDLAGDKMLPLTPTLFTTTAIDFTIGKPGAEPWEWLEFLNTLWPTSPDAIAMLQEWFGLALTAETQYQKILLLIGPKRSGKGTIARVLTRLVGIANVCGPTMAGLATNFGLAPLIHARLAIIADARLSGRTDLAIVIERLLTISGEDAITIDRKHTAAWTGRLPTRLMLMSNELPRLADASGALASRFIPLILRESFLGREDIALEARLLAELPAIFWWAVAGYRRLTARGRFIGTQAGQDAIDQLTDLASPVGAFVREWCVVKPGQQVARAELYDAWRAWCDGEGRQHTGDTAAFGRDLRAVVPGIGDTQPTIDGQRLRAYEGIGLTIAAQESARIWLSNRGAR